MALGLLCWAVAGALHAQAFCVGELAVGGDSATATLDPATAPLQAEADRSEIDIATRAGFLDGRVRVTQGWRALQAERVEFAAESGRILLAGGVRISEPGLLLSGESAAVDADSGTLSLQNAAYQFQQFQRGPQGHGARPIRGQSRGQSRGQAAQISRSPSSGILIETATYSSCPAQRELWRLRAAEIAIDEQTGRARARHVRLEAGGVPVFYAPYFQFVVDDRRASGLLYPSIGRSSDDGFIYRQPLYLNLAANRDLTLTPHLNARRGSGIEAEYRALSTQSYHRLAGSFFPQDRLNRAQPDDRWVAALAQRGQWGAWSARVDFARLSDAEVLTDWDSAALTADSRLSPHQPFLTQHAALVLDLGRWQFTAAVSDHQTLVNAGAEPYRERPRIDARAHYDLGRQTTLDLFGEWVDFARSGDAPSAPDLQASDASAVVAQSGQRSRAQLLAHWQPALDWGHFIPAAGVSYLGYRLDALRPGVDDRPDLLAAELSLDAGLQFGRRTTLFGRAGVQTLEPRIFYLRRDADGQAGHPQFDSALATDRLDALFARNLWVGGDRLDDGSRLSLGIRSRFRDSGGRERLQVGIGQTYFLTGHAPAAPARSTQRNRSPLFGEVAWQPLESLALRSRLAWDARRANLDRARLQLDYRATESDNFLSLAYERDHAPDMTDAQIEQFDLRGHWALNERWRLSVRWQEDAHRRRSLERLVGLGYRGCCWNLGVAWRDELRRTGRGGAVRSDRGLLLRLELVGLGGLGTAIDEWLAP